MKKKSASHSAFFNPRVLLGVLIVLAGVSLALFAANPFGRGTVRNQQQNQTGAPAIDPSVLPPGFDCSQVFNMGINRQDNMLAGLIMLACGYTQPASPVQGSRVFGDGGLSQWMEKLLPEPLFIGGGDVDVVVPDGTFPKVTQSESMEWCHANTCVVNYNDSRTAGSCYSGISYSSDGGATWHPSQQLCTGHGTNFGDPIVVYNENLGMWFAGDLATGCGGQGVGLWTPLDGITWIPGACAANLGGGAGDRESMWVDNNPASSHFGRMYISFNNFALGGGALQVVYSDNGTVWTPAITLNASFIRDIQITGDLQNSGRVYVAAMNEEGGGLTTRQNVMYRSTDGGVTWASTTIGGTFPAPGRQNCTQNSYFVCMFNTPITQWRHMGWGEPVANGNFVSVNYAQHGAGADLGDIYFVRSTDAGVTFGTPIKLNTDTGTAMQWQPSMAGGPNGAIFASWYDQREVNGGADLSCTVGLSTQNCYRRWGRISTDNGATWQADDMVGRALSPLPAQPDGAVQPNYQGDYDYHSSLGTTMIGGWTDGRNIISGNSQQDVFVNLVQGASPTASPTPTPSATASPSPTNTPTPTPCVGQYTITQIAGTIVPGTTDIGNHCDDCVTTIALPFPYTLYDQSFTSVNLSSNGNAQFTTTDNNWVNSCPLPWFTHNYTIMPYWGDLYTVNAGFGIFTSVSGTPPNRIFNIEWRNQYYPGSGTASFELRLYEGQSRFDIIYGTLTNGNTSTTAGVQKDDSTFVEYFCNGAGMPPT